MGARWQKRFVEVHDSYQFESKSYHSMQYHFRSIDTWLQGICRRWVPVWVWVWEEGIGWLLEGVDLVLLLLQSLS